MIINVLQERYGKETPLTVTRGKVHEYLGMTIDFSEPGKVKFSMQQYVDLLLDECPDEFNKGSARTPATNHLFETNDEADKLNKEDSETYHHLVAKLLYLSKRTRPDLQLTVAFLTTRVQLPDINDWKKLGRCLKYLRESRDLPMTLEASGDGIIRWWVDASFGVHGDLKSHTGASMSMGRGCPINFSSKQKINTRSSTEAELVGANDAMTPVLWVRLFLQAQGFEVQDNIVYQDNQSTMLLEKNGRQSSGKKTRHIEIRYYFITDNIKRGNVRVEYCPTDQMIADFFTKPLQGSAFLKYRALILGLPPLSGSQECVGTSNAGTAVCGNRSQPVKRSTYVDVAKRGNVTLSRFVIPDHGLTSLRKL